MKNIVILQIVTGTHKGKCIASCMNKSAVPADNKQESRWNFSFSRTVNSIHVENEENPTWKMCTSTAGKFEDSIFRFCDKTHVLANLN